MARGPEVLYINQYVSGSVAYQYQPEKSKVRLPKQKKAQAALSVKPASIVMLALAAVLILALLISAVQLVQATNSLNAMQERVAELKRENSALEKRYENGYDLEEIRELVTAMGYIPIAQAQTVTVPVTVPQTRPEPSAWEDFAQFVREMFS